MVGKYLLSGQLFLYSWLALILLLKVIVIPDSDAQKNYSEYDFSTVRFGTFMKMSDVMIEAIDYSLKKGLT